ncbi:hypothetical protein GH714_015406 [Hevea brasiliensis]|uniref:AAA-type ATPase N-terminal domain-containing protein n=1 Tax=Hevea brasiliensis TaxID=3981 RepID=A0A6A6KS51_HEVBR|nr:hypothetical protein GH714_015406 [Hevea brasiliensis]
MEQYLKLIPSNASLLSAYSSISTSWVLFKTAYNQVIPKQLQDYAVSKFKSCFYHNPSFATFIIEDMWCGLGRNQLYDAARAYLSTKIGPENRKIKIGKLEQHKNVSAAIVGGGKIVDVFQDITITWWCVQEEEGTTRTNTKISKATDNLVIPPQAPSTSAYKITFDNKYRAIVQNDYLIHVLNTYKALIQKEKVLKLYTRLDKYEAEELMKSDDADVALGEVVNFLKRKKREEDQIEEESKRQRTV